MTEQDKEVFASAMRTCIGDRYLNVYLNDERINSWFEGLKGYKLQDVNMALRTLSEENTQPFSLAMVLKRLKTFVGENPAELQMLAQMGLNEFLREYLLIGRSPLQLALQVICGTGVQVMSLLCRSLRKITFSTMSTQTQ